MQAILSTAAGGPESLILAELETPAPKNDEVLISVKAAGVNFPDTLIIQDLYQIKPQRPFSPGGELSGVIKAVGKTVKNFKIGDRVLAIPGFGGFVTQICVPAAKVIKIPNNMPFDEASCFIFTYGTSHYALHDRANLSADETLLVTGAAGGVGAAAIEVGKALGAKVIAAVSSHEKSDFCKGLGADATIIYPRAMDRDAQKALSASVKELVGPKGVDVVFDAVGGDYAEPFLRSMAWNGRFLVVGFPAGIPNIPLNLTLLKSCQIVGVFWGAFTIRDPAKHEKYLADLFKMYSNGQVKPRITKNFSLTEAAKALTYVAERRAVGKVVLTID